MTEPLNIVPFPDSGNLEWIESYQQACLTKLDEATIDAYLRILRQFTEWVAGRPGYAKHFQPDQLTMTIVEGYLTRLKEQAAIRSPETGCLKHRRMGGQEEDSWTT